jgi:SAM-dependent methyltransferase
MIRTSVDTAAGSHPVVYAGRFADQISPLNLPDACSALSEWEVLPSQLSAALERATTLIVLDPFSFPFEAMTEDQWDIPLVVVLPSGFGAAFLVTVFGEVLFERLGFFDRVAVEDPEVWEQLCRRYRWTPTQRMESGSVHPGTVATEICDLLEAEFRAPTYFGGAEYEPVRYWRERADALAASVPHRAICAVHDNPRFNKAVHRVQVDALEPQFAAARGGRADGTPFDVLEVGVGVGRWALAFDPAKTRFVGVDISGGMVEATRTNFQEGRFEEIEADLIFPYADESFDLAFTVDVLHHNPTPAKRVLLSEMWRVTRPGGRLMFLEDFVSERRPKSTVYPMSVLRFVSLVGEATAGRVVLEHVESLRYPHDPFFRSGLLALSKVGVPQIW